MYAVTAVIINRAWAIPIRCRLCCTAEERSCERGGHKFVEITRSPKISFRNFIELLAVCAVAPSG
jgi:hypothetical protein